MPGFTLEESNAALRSVVEARLAHGIIDEGEDMVLPDDIAVTESLPCCKRAEVPSHPSRLPRGAEEWRALHRELFDLHSEKTKQYGHEDSAFANVEASAMCGVEPWRRALCDLSDCVVRMQRYANGQPVDYENALKDAAMWAMICLVMLRRDLNACELVRRGV